MMAARSVPHRPILIVDDEQDIVASLTHLLNSNGLNNVVGCSDSRETLDLVRRQEPEVILLDLTMPHVSGQTLLSQLHDTWPYIPVIVVTGTDQVESAVECMSSGAFDYVVKVEEETRLLSGVRRAIERRSLEEGYRQLKERLLATAVADPAPFGDLVTVNRAMQAVFLLIESVAGSDEPILLSGESGVGKTLLARAIHKASGRKGSYVEVNVAGLDDTMFADTLFGHLKGAFTEAVDKRGGLIQQAAGGTLLLDEIGDLSPASQTKLLQLFDTYEYYPLGSDLARRAEARFIVATNHDLERLLAEGRFRTDLYYRLLTHGVRVPPLRERKDDLAPLLDHFVGVASQRLGKKRPRIPPELLRLLEGYDFPGNVRELEHMVLHALAGAPASVLPLAPFRGWLAQRPWGTSPAPSAGSDPSPGSPARRGWPQFGTPGAPAGTTAPAGSTACGGTPVPPNQLLTFGDQLPTVQQARYLLFEEALRRAGGNKSVAARTLGISHQAFSKAWMRLGRTGS
jgi:DNA-binding NtrC family response regulator